MAKINVYMHWSRVTDTVPIVLYCRKELVELEGTHYGQFRVPVRMNQVAPVAQALW